MKKGMGFKRGMGILCLTVVIAAFNNCAGSKSAPGAGSGSASSSGSSAGLSAFKTTLYAYAKSQNCVMCHASTIHPFFGSADVNLAYTEAKGEIDFANPSASVLATYAGNAHCAAAPCSQPANTDAVKTLLATWATAELAAPATGGGGGGGGTGSGPPKYLTAAVAVPANIPTLMSSATPGVVRFQLSAMSPAVASLSGAVLEIEIQKANMGTYRINRIKIQGNTAAVKVTGVHIYVKAPGTAGVGIEDTNQGVGWIDSTATAPTSTLPGTLPAGPLTATPLFTNAQAVQMQSTADMITIGIEDIQ